MLMTLIFILILLVLYFIIKSNKQTDQIVLPTEVKRTTDLNSSDNIHTQPSYMSNNFSSVKIINNDNELEKIVPDFERRKEEAISDLTTRLGKALPNDVIWSILQGLTSEFFIVDHKTYLNAVYQQGLLVQKEKKYKQAISHYAYGLYYLLNFYIAQFKPTAHLIDYVENETQLIEMAQHKFINKIQLCMEYGDLNIDEVKEVALALVNISPLPNLESRQFIIKIQTHLHIREKFDSQNFPNQTFESLGIPFDDKLFEGMKFSATLQLRTPLEILKHHGEIHRGNTEPPRYAKEMWHGIWLPKVKKKYALGIDSFVSTDIGSLSSEEANIYLDFLIKFHTISESELDVEGKVAKIKELYKNDSNFKKYYNKQTGGNKDFLESYFNLLIKNVLPPKVTKSLNEAGFRTLKDLKGVDTKELLKLEGVGKATIDKLSPYLILL